MQAVVAVALAVLEAMLHHRKAVQAVLGQIHILLGLLLQEQGFQDVTRVAVEAEALLVELEAQVVVAQVQLTRQVVLALQILAVVVEAQDPQLILVTELLDLADQALLLFVTYVQL
jgi:hypothetical protein